MPCRGRQLSQSSGVAFVHPWDGPRLIRISRCVEIFGVNAAVLDTGSLEDTSCLNVMTLIRYTSNPCSREVSELEEKHQTPSVRSYLIPHRCDKRDPGKINDGLRSSNIGRMKRV